MDALVVALDIGGTKSAGLCADQNGNILSEFGYDGKNLITSGITAVSDLIVSIVREQVQKLTGSNRPTRKHICIGAAGAGVASYRSLLQDDLTARLDGFTFQVLPDTVIALEGAFHDEPGMLCITGTGSNVCVRDEAGEYHHSGGWGPRIGDPASAMQLGLDAIRALTANGFNLQETEKDSLLARIIRDHHLDTRGKVLSCVYGRSSADGSDSSDGPEKPSELARTVLDAFDKGDVLAASIVQSGIREFIVQIEYCSGQLRAGSIEHLSYTLMGGLASHAGFRARFTTEMEKCFPNWKRAEALGSPESGALRLALKHLRKKN
ncbi:MAG: hypothetical protein E2O84_01070 [Bacteroidetes bacterium]|nr:MAG: hypothetical protein E2O84_01070 [Bacteroidota bacterium]